MDNGRGPEIYDENDETGDIYRKGHEFRKVFNNQC